MRQESIGIPWLLSSVNFLLTSLIQKYLLFSALAAQTTIHLSATMT